MHSAPPTNPVLARVRAREPIAKRCRERASRMRGPETAAPGCPPTYVKNRPECAEAGDRLACESAAGEFVARMPFRPRGAHRVKIQHAFSLEMRNRRLRACAVPCDRRRPGRARFRRCAAGRIFDLFPEGSGARIWVERTARQGAAGAGSPGQAPSRHAQGAILGGLLNTGETDYKPRTAPPASEARLNSAGGHDMRQVARVSARGSVWMCHQITFSAWFSVSVF